MRSEWLSTSQSSKFFGTTFQTEEGTKEWWLKKTFFFHMSYVIPLAKLALIPTLIAITGRGERATYVRLQKECPGTKHLAVQQNCFVFLL